MIIKELYKSYGKNSVLKGISLNIPAGKITCILGESGGGKTTLLNCVARLTPCDGEIIPESPAEKNPAYIFQEPRLLPNLTVEKNLSLVTSDAEKIAAALKKVRLLGKGKEYPSALSGGEKQRVAIARALVYGDGFFLLDEPFSSLDVKLKAALVGDFFALWQQEGFTALFVTHSVNEAAALSHKICLLSGGKIEEEFSSSPDGVLFSDNPVKKLLYSALLSPDKEND